MGRDLQTQLLCCAEQKDRNKEIKGVNKSSIKNTLITGLTMNCVAGPAWSWRAQMGSSPAHTDPKEWWNLSCIWILQPWSPGDRPWLRRGCWPSSGLLGCQRTWIQGSGWPLGLAGFLIQKPVVRDPSFFLTQTTGAPYGNLDLIIHPLANRY